MQLIRFCSAVAFKNRLGPFSLGRRVQIAASSINLDPAETTFLNHPIIRQKYEVVYDSEKPDIVFLDLKSGKQNTYRYYLLALAMRRMYGWSPLLIVPYYENIRLPDLKFLDRTFSSSPPSARNITLGLRTTSLLSSDWLEHRKRPKLKFCNFLYSRSRADTAVRRAFCKLLMHYKQIDCPARSLYNTKVPVGKDMEDKIAFLADYKFTIAFESSSHPAYVTEKILHPFLVGSIPIYWGSPKIADYFNPASFINCHDYACFEDVVERVIAIDQDPELYARYVDAPITVPGNYYHDLERKVRAYWKTLVAEILERRQKQSGWLDHHARLMWMVLSHLNLDIANIRKVLTPSFRTLKTRINARIEQPAASELGIYPSDLDRVPQGLE